MTTYEEYRAMMIASSTSACEYIPKMCYALREEDPTLGNEEIKSRVTKDALATGLARDTINHHIPEEFKDPEKVKGGKKSAEKKKEMISVTNDGEHLESLVADEPAGIGSDDAETPKSKTFESQKENINTSFSNASDLIKSPPEEKQQYNPDNNLIQQIEQLKSELERVGRINERYSRELIELQIVVKKASFKPATEIKSFTFNDLPTPDNSNSFIWKKIKLDKFRMELGPIKAAGDTYFNVYLERTK